MAEISNIWADLVPDQKMPCSMLYVLALIHKAL